jgi:site-specific DNA recombinase
MFRSTKDFLDMAEFFDKNKVEFICLDAEIDTTTPAGRVFSTMRAAFAQFERETTAERVREIMLARAQRGEWNGGIIPYGLKYNREKKTLEINLSPEVATIKKMFELFLEKQTFRGTAIALNAQGYRTRAGDMWSTTSIKRILQNPVYCGALTYNKRKTSNNKIEYVRRASH